MFIDKFEQFCNDVGEKPVNVLRAVGLSPSRLTEWRKDRRKMPNQEKLYLPAEYFGCAVGDFFTDEDTSVMGGTSQITPQEWSLLEAFGELDEFDRGRVLGHTLPYANTHLTCKLTTL